jgi:hypothetical protein
VYQSHEFFIKLNETKFCKDFLNSMQQRSAAQCGLQTLFTNRKSLALLQIHKIRDKFEAVRSVTEEEASFGM